MVSSGGWAGAVSAHIRHGQREAGRPAVGDGGHAHRGTHERPPPGWHPRWARYISGARWGAAAAEKEPRSNRRGRRAKLRV
ncbi:hypothetical protein chiPu_0028945 [Chiloscyllium punctatum]|uniref:Uncharacterized protein n=1 Tax=Chiloscyllium punctatum TaxID=137246 RepID=A0A401TQG8_CHIPU|nr:hypothetical protein [Chiloscyllium punctatum]